MRKSFFLLQLSFIIIANTVFAQKFTVNHLTGTGNAFIPINTASSGAISVPINLVYTANTRPKDIEGDAGMGWNLQAGGQVSRQVRGLPDDVVWNGKGWLYSNTGAKISAFNFANDNNPATCTDESTDISYLNSNFPDSLDTEPDIFNVNAPGLSFQFVFDKDKNVRILSKEDVKVSWTFVDYPGNYEDKRISSITVVNDKGVTYIFSDGEETTKSATSPNESLIKYFKRTYNQYKIGKFFTGTWKLTRMVDPDGNSVNFNYTSGLNETMSQDTIALYIGGAATKSVQYILKEQRELLSLTSITKSTPDDVDQTVIRVDWTFPFSWDAPNAPRVARQSLIKNIRGLGKNYEFFYNSTGYTSFGSTPGFAGPRGFQRLFLKRFRDSTCNSAIDLTFKYANERLAMSTFGDSSTRKIDYWGFYTGTGRTNGTLKPAVYVNPSNAAYQRYALRTATTAGGDYIYSLGNYNAAVAYRSADKDSVMTGNLTEILNATGGTTTITYESNDYLDVPSGANNYGNGIRVKQIAEYDGISADNNMLTNYTYTDPATGKSSGKPVSLPVYAFATPYTGTATGASYWNNSTVLSETDLSDDDHSVLYKYVRESHPGAGSMLYEYYMPATYWDNTAVPSCDQCATADWAPTVNNIARTSCTSQGPVRNDIYAYPFAPNLNYDFERGLMKSVKSFDEGGAHKVSETNYTYQRAAAPAVISGLTVEDNSTSAVKAYAKYGINIETAELTTKVESKLYDQPDYLVARTTTTNYIYGSANHKLLTQQKVNNSDNSTSITNIKYAKDYTANTGTDPAVVAIRNLQLKNINVPVETIQQVQRGSVIKTTGSKLTRFKPYTVNTVVHNLPAQQLSFVAPGGVTDFQPFAISSGAASQDARYIPIININTYDFSGRAVSSDNANKQTATAFIDYYANAPAAVFTNAADTEVAYSNFDTNPITSTGPFTLTGTSSVVPISSHSGNSLGFSTSQTLSKVLTKNAAAQNYIFSIWIFTPTAGNLAIKLTPASGTPITYTKSYSGDNQKWQYYEWKIPVASMTSSFTVSCNTSLNLSIDDVLFYPENSKVTTYAYDTQRPLKIAETNTNGVSTYYEYDDAGRLIYVYDQDKNIVKRTTYQVATNDDDDEFANLAIAYDQSAPSAPRTAIVFSPTARFSCANTVTYTWNFGDGSGNQAGNGNAGKSHAYSTPGTYTVSLTINSPTLGSKTVTTSVYIDGGVQLVYSTSATSAGTVDFVQFTPSHGSPFTVQGDALNSTYIPKDNYTIKVVVTGGAFYNLHTGAGYTCLAINGSTFICYPWSSTGIYTTSMNLSSVTMLGINIYKDVNCSAVGAFKYPLINIKMNLRTLIILLSVVITMRVQQASAQNPGGLIKEDVIKVPGVTIGTDVDYLSADNKITTHTYLDGFARTIQVVQQKASPLGMDIIQPVAYNALGQQVKSYLPYLGSDGSGSYRADAISAGQPGFYNNGTGDKVADDGSPFSQQVFENSPLQRVLKEGMTGTDFQPTGTQHYKTITYRSNSATADGNIINWGPDGSNQGSYSDQALAVADGIDEGGLESISYTDNSGRVVLKRQLNGSARVDTYYIYNEAGTVSYVIPPLALKKMISLSSYDPNNSLISKLVFKYVYDERGRLVEKTVPGAGVVYIVYDPLSRPVLIQDANLRLAHQWNYIKYSADNKAISQGIYKDDIHIATRQAMQSYVTVDLAAAYSTAWFESRSNISATGYYNNNVFPTTGITALAYSYFDDYDLDGDAAHVADYSYTPQLTGEAAQTVLTRGLLTMTRTRTVGSGLADIWLTKIIFYDKYGHTIQVKSNNQLTAAISDIKTIVPDFTGVPKQVQEVKVSAAGTGGTVTVLSTYTYDHLNRIKAVDQTYNSGGVIHVAAYTYNELGQLVDKQLGIGGTVPETINLAGTYSGNNSVLASGSITMSDTFNVPSGSTFSAAIGTSCLQSVDYRYNIRGQLLSINNSKLSNDGVSNDDNNDLFGMTLLYDKSDANLSNSNYFDGKLSAVKWMYKNASGVSSNEKAYKYSYDGLNRYTAANYIERASSSTGAFDTYTGAFTENTITYDDGGNILTLKRNAMATPGTIALVDNLSYVYDDAANPNQLKTVTDGTGSNYTGYGFKNLTGSTGNYTYDANGKLQTDPYKNLSISYNLINRTDKITMSYQATGRWIDYTYNSSGNVIRKRQYDNNALVNTTDYIDGFVYLNGKLSFFNMPEGRVRNTGTGTTVTLKPEYIITDQQGNARVSFEESSTTPGTAVVRQENSYYGFGLAMPGSTVSTPSDANKQLYNGGSEWQNDFSSQPDYYQTFYRNYDATLGRFIGVDPQPESAESMTTYQYAGNNPIMFNDPMGDIRTSSGTRILWSPVPMSIMDSYAAYAYDNYWGFVSDDHMQIWKDARNFDGPGNGACSKCTVIYKAGAPDNLVSTEQLADLLISNKVSIDFFTGNLRWTEQVATVDYKSGAVGAKFITHTGRSSANQEGSSEEPFDWLGNYGKANAFVGVEVFLLNRARATGRLEIAAESVRGLKSLGIAGAIAGTAMDGIGVFNYYHPTKNNVNSRVTLNKFAIDGGMTALGVWGGPPGEATAAYYFGIDAFYPGGVAGFGKAQVSEPIDGVVITGSL